MAACELSACLPVLSRSGQCQNLRGQPHFFFRPSEACGASTSLEILRITRLLTNMACMALAHWRLTRGLATFKTRMSDPVVPVIGRLEPSMRLAVDFWDFWDPWFPRRWPLCATQR